MQTVETGLPVKRATLFRWSALAAYSIALLLLGEIAVFAIFPPITDPTALLADFAQNWLVGLLRFDLLGMAAYLLLIPVTFSLYNLTRPANDFLAAFSAVLFFIGIAMFFSTNTGFAVLSLGKQYALAATETEKSQIVSACLSMITLFKVNAFMLSYIIVSASWAFMSVAMHRSKIFKRLTTMAGMLAGASGILAEIFENASAYLRWPAIFLYFAAIVFLIIWIMGVGRALSKLRKIHG